MKFALAGNPNSGKTTLFNALTGSTAHVGNWPGVTVDKKTGVYKKSSERPEIIDLPGIYSLSPYTPEEIVSRNYLLDEMPDAIINIVDATNLERNLYLTTQLLELDIPVVIALNMMDVVEKNGGDVDIKALSETLGAPVTAISALKGKGIKELMEKTIAAAKTERLGYSVLSESAYKGLYADIKKLYTDNNIPNSSFCSVKLLESDSEEVKKHPDFAVIADELKKNADTGVFNGDFEGVVADARYRFIDKRLSNTIKKTIVKEGLSKSDKIDKTLTHKIWGIPIFLLIMFAVFHLTFSENFLFIGLFIPEGSFDIPIIGTDAINSPGVMLFNCMDLLTSTIGDAVGGAMPEGTWYTSLVTDGLLSGVFAVLSFIPQILFLFLFLSILEDSGYMARVAFIMDRAFRKFGLSGKAFMPLLMCFGCAVPGIMATRTLENEAERRRTIMLTPFFSCGAKLPIWAAFAGVFATARGMSGDFIVFSMYLLGIVIAIVSAIILKKTAVKGETPPFIMELPAYHLPQIKNLLIHLWEKLRHYIVRAATIIAGAVIVIWFLSSFGWNFRMVEDSGDSIIGSISKVFTWLFVPLGFGLGENGWKFVVAAFTGLIAKEMVVATMGTFSGLDGDSALDMEGSALADTALGTMMLGIGGVLGGVDVAIPAMFAFMAFNLLSVPCMAAVAAASGELRSRKKLWGAIGYWMLTAYTVSMLIFWIGTFITWCWWAALIAAVLLIGIAVALIILVKKGKIKKIPLKNIFKGRRKV